MVVSPGFWRNKKVLVTGHSGFKGGWLCLWLQHMGADVVGFSRSEPPTTPSLFEVTGAAEDMPSLQGDIRDLEQVQAVVSENRPEIVIHMAAQALVRSSYGDPVGTYGTNVMGTVNLLEAVRRSDHVRVVINVTTDKVYENRELERGYTEEEPKGGSDPYSNSKACSELVTSAYRESFFNAGADGQAPAVASARAGNVIGGGDWGNDRLIPDILRGATERRTVTIRNPDAVRPWQHVLSALSGYLVLAQALWGSSAHAGGWNFGPQEDDAKPVRWIIERLAEMWGEEIRWAQAGGAQPPETQYLRLDPSKARAELGWRPGWNLEQALRSIVAWHRAFEAGEDPRELVLGQIEAFQGESSSARAPVEEG